MKITTQNINIDHFWNELISNSQVNIDPSVFSIVQKNRDYLAQRLAKSSDPIYGINTGFGSLCNVQIKPEEMEELQHNLVVSHACGTGDLVPQEIVKTIFILKLVNLSKGYSGVRVELLKRLQAYFNKGISPIIYQLGSLGASGDLAPLAHLSLPLLGVGDVLLNGEKFSAKDALNAIGEKTLALSYKEGLALLNGTQFSLAYALHATKEADRLYKIANVTAAISMMAFNCILDPYHPSLHKVRGQKGQMTAAADIFEILKASNLASLANKSVQDPYSFRCTPQVHGASKTAIDHIKEIVEIEINAVTDNPTVFEDEDMVLSGGNFHAQPLALPMDYLAMALAEIGNISERRTYKLINGERELPAYLAKNPGLESGYMICQYTAASIVSQNKQLANPACTDSIVSSKGQEDHVSMAANAGTKLYRIVENLYRIISIEFMIATSALEYRSGLELPVGISELVKKYREEVSVPDGDIYLSPEMHNTETFLKNNFSY